MHSFLVLIKIEIAFKIKSSKIRPIATKYTVEVNFGAISRFQADAISVKRPEIIELRINDIIVTRNSNAKRIIT